MALCRRRNHNEPDLRGTSYFHSHIICLMLSFFSFTPMCKHVAVLFFCHTVLIFWPGQAVFAHSAAYVENSCSKLIPTVWHTDFCGHTTHEVPVSCVSGGNLLRRGDVDMSVCAGVYAYHYFWLRIPCSKRVRCLI